MCHSFRETEALTHGRQNEQTKTSFLQPDQASPQGVAHLYYPTSANYVSNWTQTTTNQLTLQLTPLCFRTLLIYLILIIFLTSSIITHNPKTFK